MREKVQLSNVLWNTVLFVLKYRDKNQPQFSLYNPCNWVTPFLQFTQKSTVIPFFPIFLSSTCWIFFLPFNRAYIFFYNSCINIFQEACVFFKKIFFLHYAQNILGLLHELLSNFHVTSLYIVYLIVSATKTEKS